MSQTICPLYAISQTIPLTPRFKLFGLIAFLLQFDCILRLRRVWAFGFWALFRFLWSSSFWLVFCLPDFRFLGLGWHFSWRPWSIFVFLFLPKDYPIPTEKTSEPSNLPMNQLFLLSLLILSVSCYVESQSTSDQDNFPPQGQINPFTSVLTVIAGIMAVMFSLTLFLVAYAKYWYRGDTGLVHNNEQTTNIIISSGNSQSSGIDKAVIESLPLFRFSALRGLREGLECAVCLSKFEDIEILRLLPKCKHAFHTDCIGEWLERHASCPLCRHKISAEDVAMAPYSNSLRFLTSQADVREDSNMELLVEREESCRKSSRFSIGNSFREFEKGSVVKEEKLPIQEDCDDIKRNDNFLQKYNHKIVMFDIVLKRRWSNLSSPDLVFLNSEMLAAVSSSRFSSLDSNARENSTTQAIEEGGITNIKDKKWDFETIVGKLNQNGLFPSSSGANTSTPTRVLSPNDKRSMSEITVHSRFKEFDFRNAAKEERLKRIWLLIAQRTVQGYADGERTSQLSNNTSQSLNV